ncbi:MAG: hypothetical protein WB760_14245 [Xanthobacteraceae bacterium]
MARTLTFDLDADLVEFKTKPGDPPWSDAEKQHADSLMAFLRTKRADIEQNPEILDAFLQALKAKAEASKNDDALEEGIWNAFEAAKALRKQASDLGDSGAVKFYDELIELLDEAGHKVGLATDPEGE